MKEFTNQNLGLGVLALDLTHVIASLLFGMDVGHSTKVSIRRLEILEVLFKTPPHRNRLRVPRLLGPGALGVAAFVSGFREVVHVQSDQFPNVAAQAIGIILLIRQRKIAELLFYARSVVRIRIPFFMQFEHLPERKIIA